MGAIFDGIFTGFSQVGNIINLDFGANLDAAVGYQKFSVSSYGLLLFHLIPSIFYVYIQYEIVIAHELVISSTVTGLCQPHTSRWLYV